MSKVSQKLFLIYAAVIVLSFAVLSPLIKNQAVNHYVLFFSGVVMALFLSFITAHFFIRTINELKETTRRMSEEDLESKTKEITEDQSELRAILSNMIEGVIVIGRDERV